MKLTSPWRAALGSWSQRLRDLHHLDDAPLVVDRVARIVSRVQALARTPRPPVTGQAFGFNAILGLIGIGGILMRNTLIFTDQIEQKRRAGSPLGDAIVEATVRRARPVVLTALAAAFAFVPLTFSVFWSELAFVLIGGVLAGTVVTLLFLPALCALGLREAETQPRVSQHDPARTG
jgi:hypothetical protein